MYRCKDCKALLCSGSLCLDCGYLRHWAGQKATGLGPLHPDEIAKRDRIQEMKMDPLEATEDRTAA